MTTGIAVRLNGEPKHFSAPLILSDLVLSLGLDAERVAIELNRAIVKRERWGETTVGDGAELEIVQFVGGG